MLSNNVNSQAMLIHHHEKTGQVDVTSHRVIELKGGRGFTLGAGRAFNQKDKQVLLDLLIGEEPKMEFLPTNLLVRSRGCLVWHIGPQVIDVPFSSGQITAPIPGLIFVATEGRSLRCFAYAGNKRPEPQTQLFYAPLGNVYESGDFCSGNVSLPSQILIENIPTWERFVLESTNTHNGSVAPIKGAVGFEDMVTFYRNLAASKAKRFPANKLVPARLNGDKATLESVLRSTYQ